MPGSPVLDPLATQLYVRCNPLLDITSTVDLQYLEAFGLTPDAEFIYDNRSRGLFESMESRPDTVLSPGGSGLHTARVAQWILQKHYFVEHPDTPVTARPMGVVYVGCIGKDGHGKLFRDMMAVEGVTMYLEETDKAPTGVCAVCKLPPTSTSVRTLVANLGAASELTAEFLQMAPVATARAEAPIVYTTAYATPVHAEQTVILAAGTRAPQADESRPKRLFAVGLSSKNFLEAFGEDLVDVLERMDLVVGNSDEIRDLAVILQWVPTEMTDEEVVQRLATEMMYDGHAVRTIVMTRGADSVLYATSDGRMGSVNTLPTESKKRKSTGVGDAFTGGLLASLLVHPGNIQRACEVGNEAAQYVLEHSIQTMLPADAPNP